MNVIHEQPSGHNNQPLNASFDEGGNPVHVNGALDLLVAPLRASSPQKGDPQHQQQEGSGEVSRRYLLIEEEVAVKEDELHLMFAHPQGSVDRNLRELATTRQRLDDRMVRYLDPPYDLFNTGSLFINVALTVPWVNDIAKWVSLIHYGLFLNLVLAIPIFVFKILCNIDYTSIVIGLTYFFVGFVRFFSPGSFGGLAPVHDRQTCVFKFKKMAMVMDCALAEMLKDRIRHRTNPYLYLHLEEASELFKHDVRTRTERFFRKCLAKPKKRLNKLIGRKFW